MHHFATPTLLAVVWLSLTSFAAAQDEGDDPRVAQARAEFTAGEEAFEQRLFVAAGRHFEATYRLLSEASHPRAFLALYNLARAYEESGAFQRAAETYERYLAEGGGEEENRRLVEARIRDLRERPAVRTGGATENPEPRTARSGDSISPVGPIILAIGGAAAVAAVILGSVSLAASDGLAADCPAQVGCDPSLMARYDSMRLMAGATDVLGITAAVVMAAGVVLTLSLRESHGATAALTISPDRALLHARWSY